MLEIVKDILSCTYNNMEVLFSIVESQLIIYTA